jgi:hypothetical protein
MLFEEFAEDVSARPALKKICRLLGERLLKRVNRTGRIKKVTYFEDPSGWLQ